MRVGGVFEDGTWSEFAAGLLGARAPTLGHEVELTVRLTKGCRFDWLQHHLEDLLPDHHGLLIGVDGKKLAVPAKRAALAGSVRDLPAEVPVLWAVALPSIEAWMLADRVAVPAALTEVYGAACRRVDPPAAPRAEGAAKEALSRWVEELIGERLLRGGREVAAEVGGHLRPEHVARARHPELARLLEQELPAFLDRCAARAASLG